MLKNNKASLFLLSFLILFLELVFIRYLPSQIYYLGYYSNFILLASFVGIGVGILLAKDKRELIWYFPWLLLLTIAIGTIFTISVYSLPSGQLQYQNNFRGVIIPEIAVIPLLFAMIVFTMASLAQRLGRLLNLLPPLTAYKWDIIGSLTGILIFTLFSYWYLNPLFWFFTLSVVFLLVIWEKSKYVFKAALAMSISVIIIIPAAFNNYWSPYQKLTVEPLNAKNISSEYIAFDDAKKFPDNQIFGYRLYANNISHQTFIMDDFKKEEFYELSYKLFSHNDFRNVLIIGAGTGTDVQIAIRNNVAHIDALEIDPVIQKIGLELHPEQPYQDSRVTTYIDDARSFLQKTEATYDLIIFALPDSVILAAARGNIRLESFLYTTEAFTAAKSKLSPGGLLVLYNYYRQPWFIERLAGMLGTVFGQDPYVLTSGLPSYRTILMSGEKLDDLLPTAPTPLKLEPPYPKPTTDDWPFMYIRNPSLPWTYFFMLLVLGVITYLVVSRATKSSLHRTIEPSYFFLGLAFLLLETKSLVQFSLLFGNTWIVNSLVFFAILSMVLLAIFVVSKIKINSIKSLYIILALTLALQYFFPADILLEFNVVIKYIVVSLVTLFPIFIANIIFSYLFKQSENNSNNFASNILGAAVGGMVEYLALVVGYRNLLLIVAICYLMAFAWPYMQQRNRLRLVRTD